MTFDMQTLAQEIINIEKTKQENSDFMWETSPFKSINELKTNNVGVVGEKVIKEMLKMAGIYTCITGSSSRTFIGDGLVKNKSVEIKTARLGKTKTFQHELGEEPWLCHYLILVDFTPKCFYITVMKNFSEEHYLSPKRRAMPYFNKAITRRKETACFKLTTNEYDISRSVSNGDTIMIDSETSPGTISSFFNSKIKYN